MLRYLETYFKSRYLVSEVAIATSRRQVGLEHWRFCADKLSERNSRYETVAPNVIWLLTPTKVTAHRELLREYIYPGKFKSWAVELLNAATEISRFPSVYFNPAAVSNLNDFFLCDSHWRHPAARNYIQPILSAIGANNDELALRLDKTKHQGNCTFGTGDQNSLEDNISIESTYFSEVFYSHAEEVPDFSVRLGVNENVMPKRGLVIHSSSYSYARGLFRSIFSSITEVFSPYVPADVIALGKFDHVIVFVAERNCAVVYDGGAFNDRIKLALNTPYIKKIAGELKNYGLADGCTQADLDFLRGLGAAWLGDEE